MAPVLFLLFLHTAVAQELLANPACNQPADRGDCTSYVVQWHYDRFAHRCRQFYYGGCNGNANRFNSQQECDSSCRFLGVEETKQQRCSQPPDPGHCQSDIERFHFDWTTKQCVCGTWTGCGGNSNRYFSFEHCMDICGEFAVGDGGRSQIEASRIARQRQTMHSFANQRTPVVPVRMPPEQIRHLQPQRDVPPSILERRIQQAVHTSSRQRTHSGGQTQIIRHNPDGTTTVVKTLRMHPVQLARRLMEKMRSGQAATLDDAIVGMREGEGESASLTHETLSSLPNYAYISNQPQAAPVFAHVPVARQPQPPPSSPAVSSGQFRPVSPPSQVSQSVPASPYQRPRPVQERRAEAHQRVQGMFNIPSDPEERRRLKETLKKKKIPPRQIYPTLPPTPTPTHPTLPSTFPPPPATLPPPQRHSLPPPARATEFPTDVRTLPPQSAWPSRYIPRPAPQTPPPPPPQTPPPPPQTRPPPLPQTRTPPPPPLQTRPPPQTPPPPPPRTPPPPRPPQTPPPPPPSTTFPPPPSVHIPPSTTLPPTPPTHPPAVLRSAQPEPIPIEEEDDELTDSDMEPDVAEEEYEEEEQAVQVTVPPLPTTTTPSPPTRPPPPPPTVQRQLHLQPPTQRVPLSPTKKSLWSSYESDEDVDVDANDVDEDLRS